MASTVSEYGTGSAKPSHAKGKELKPIAEVALALLARREHAVAELRRKLSQKGYDRAAIATVLAEMQERNYLNDARYAVARARSRVQSSKWGWGRVAQELAGVGITPEAIMAAKMALEEDGVSLTEGGVVLARRKLNSGSKRQVAGSKEEKEALYKQRQKTLAMLLRKGYSFADAKKMLEEAAAGVDEVGLEEEDVGT
ncbi:MAG: regulatory protein RecX [Alphaproteobacteria bacterium]